jgi:SAM-dependent methyltransferase
MLVLHAVFCRDQANWNQVMFMRKHCPICGSCNHIQFAVIDHRNLVACRECSLVFANSFDEEELVKCYSQNYYSSPHDPRIQAWIDRNRPTWAGVVADISRAKSPVANLLDIGAGTGGFLEVFRQYSPATKLYAIESSPAARQNLVERFPSLVFCGETAEGITAAAGQFECVTLLQCLEHVYDPLRVCSGIYRVLNPGGVLLITVPNRYSYKVLLKKTAEANCFGNKTHLQFFSLRTLRRLLAEAGFQEANRITRFGGSAETGVMAAMQCLVRKVGISTEIRVLVRKQP